MKYSDIKTNPEVQALIRKADANEDRLTMVAAIGHHDESTGGAIDIVSAALIIADKTDVRRNRVREKPKATFKLVVNDNKVL